MDGLIVDLGDLIADVAGAGLGLESGVEVAGMKVGDASEGSGTMQSINLPFIPIFVAHAH